MSTSTKTYHHGDLRAALVAGAVEMLEAGEPYSMRAVARRAGVSPTAPYRHFPDRTALDSAIAVEGFKDLRKALERALAEVPDDAAPACVLGEFGVAYVTFALNRPEVFRLMFGNECDTASSDRVQAAQELHTLLGDVLARLYPGAASPTLATALWGLAHGLAFLHVDGKFPPEPADDVAQRTRDAIAAIIESRPEARNDL